MGMSPVCTFTLAVMMSSVYGNISFAEQPIRHSERTV